MIRAGIIGATGYAGMELVRILQNHPEAELVYLGSRSGDGGPYTDTYGNLNKILDLPLEGEDLSLLPGRIDVLFTATPQGYCASVITEELLTSMKVIDLSADFRIKDPKRYETWYGITHATPEFLPEAVYGLCERERGSIRGARLVANPGCYPTCSILAIAPLLEGGLIDPDTLIIDAKSGVTGAGRSAKVANLYCEVHDSIRAYGVSTHRHTPEIEDQLGKAAGRDIVLNFTPHLTPMSRGILVTAYAKAAPGVTKEAVTDAYRKAYENETFVRVLPYGMPPETRLVKGSNYADVSAVYDERTGRVIMMGAIDNLVKGAAGQAVQNMNLMFGLPEETGLTMIPMGV